MKALLSLALLVSSSMHVSAAWPWAKAKPQPQFTMAAVVALVTPEAEAQKAGEAVWTAIKAGDQFSDGTVVRTKARGSVTFLFSDGTKVRIGPNASFKLEETKSSRVSIYIGLGKMESWVKKFAGRSFQARNPVAVASVRGTDFVMDVISPTEVTMDLFTGSLEVTDNFGNSTAISEGQRLTADGVSGSAPPAPLPPSAKMDVPPPAPPAIEKLLALIAAGGPPPGAPPPGAPAPGAKPGTPPPPGTLPPGTLPPGTLPPGTLPPPGMLPPPPDGTMLPPPDGTILLPPPDEILFGEPLPPLNMPPPNVNQEASTVSPSAPPPPPP